MVAVVMLLEWLAAACFADETIRDISPDGRFAVYEQRSGEIVDAHLIALPSREKVMRLANGAGHLVWTPDSRRFARSVEEGVHNITLAIYGRSGAELDVIARIDTFPSGSSATKSWPKRWQDTGREHQELRPIRWLDRETLLLGAHHSVRLQQGEESTFWQLDAQFTAKLGPKGKLTKSPLTILRRGFIDAEKSPPKLVSDHVDAPRDWQVSGDQSIALVEAEGVLDLIEQRAGEAARVTHLWKQIEELFLPDFRDCGAEPLDAAQPFRIEGDWLLQGTKRVVIRCEASTNRSGDQRSKMWCARLDAVWSIKEAKFIEQKVVRGFCGTLGDGDNARVAAHSPSFRIEVREQLDVSQRATGEFQAFIVSKKTGDAEPLAHRLSAEQAPSAAYRISPDERSIFAEWGSSQGSFRTLFARGEGERFARAIADPASGEDGFEQAMWEFCRTTAGHEPPPSQRDCAFVAWAPDFARLLLSLRVEIKGTVRDWKVYWNTRTRSFELTPFLTELNARAAEESFSSLKPFCAEPVDPLPALEALDRQLAEARPAFDENWKECSAAENQRIEKNAPRTWPEIEKKAATWRVDGIAEIEKLAAEFSHRWPEPEREEWRRLSLAGGFRALGERIAREWPWR
jgi:hypothetical protein